MGRPRSKPLPRGIHERAHRSGRKTYAIDFRDQHGERHQEAAGTTLDEALRLLAQRRAEVAAGTYAPGASTGTRLTIESYSERWLRARAAEGVRSVEREAQIVRDHIVPKLGAIALSDLRPRDVAAWVRSLAETLAPKSVINVHGVLSSMLARAMFDELVVANVARGLPRGVLPKNVRVREVSAWTRAEIERWITPHEDVSEERTVAYAIAAFTGARVGEVAGMRWRDLDVAAEPLWRWALRSQYDGAPLKTDNPRDVPIHPELQRILSAWKLEGWARFMCRHPTPDDFVIPRNRALRSARPQHADSACHSKESLGAKAVHRHAATLGIDSGSRDFHSFRRAMITIARTDGARVDLLERVTHNAAGTMVDGYTFFGWDALCEAVSCMRIAPLAGVVVALPVASNGDADGDADGGCLAKASISADFSAFKMEAPGVEQTTGRGRTRTLAVLAGGAPTGAARVRAENPPAAAGESARVTHVTEALRAAGRDDLADALKREL